MFILTLVGLAACGPDGPEALDEDAAHAACVRGVACDLGSLPVLTPQPALDQSFTAPQALGVDVRALRVGLAASERVPEIFADLDGNGLTDVLGFGREGTWAAYNSGGTLSAAMVRYDFGFDSGWRAACHRRVVADVNGDGRLDLVGFGQAGVYTALGTTRFGAPAFGSTNYAIADFGYDQGWRVELHERALADVDGDRRADIVAFGRDGVWLARSTGAAFEAPRLVLADFGAQQGWSAAQHVRTLGDVNGDGRADIVAFGAAGVWVALSTGAGFGAPRLAIANLGYDQGWRPRVHLRRLQDIDRDGRADIVAFGAFGLWTARWMGSNFEAPRFVLADFGVSNGWDDDVRLPRVLADLNADGYIDVLGYSPEGVYRALGGPGGFGPSRLAIHDYLGGLGRGVGKLDADGLLDLIAIDDSTGGLSWARGTTQPIPPPPVTPVGLHVVRDRVDALDLAWLGTGATRKYVVSYGEPGVTQTYTTVAEVPEHNVTGLHPGTRYCFQVQAENAFGLSAKSAAICHQMSQPPEPTSGTFSILFSLQPQGGTGPAFYEGPLGPLPGRLLRLWRPQGGLGPSTTIVFPRLGVSTLECNDPSKVVVLPDGGSLGPQEITAIMGAVPQAGQSAVLAACHAASDNSLPQSFFVNADWGP